MTRPLNVAQLDFDTIKTNLREFLTSQDTLNDYDFSGSALDTILDVFAYVTHYNAFNANLAMNESFLDSAQLRSSVVSHAKLLGYTPASAQPAKAIVSVTINNPASVLTVAGTYRNIELPKGTRFTTTIDNVSYPFTTNRTYSVARNTDGIYRIDNVELVQGIWITDEYVYDVSGEETFEITSPSAVTSTLEVTVRQSRQSTAEEVYTYVKNFVDFEADSNIYFLQENRNGLYEVSFGDNVIGNKPDNGSVVRLTYISTSASNAANGASTFTLTDSIVESDGTRHADATVTTTASASGAVPREDIASIKFNAPLSFTAQNRAITPADYRAIIAENFQNIDAISVWGGENNDPPNYGNVYICVSPRDKEVLTAAEKNMISAQYIKPKNVVSITPVFVDPTYTYIHLEVDFKYNSNITDLSRNALEGKVRDAIAAYDRAELRKFNGVFRASNMLSSIDAADPSIINSTLRVQMKKRFTPVLRVPRRYDIAFSSPIFEGNQIEQTITSSGFHYLTRLVELRDARSADGSRRIQIIASGGSDNIVVVQDNAGTVNTATGQVTLTSLNPESINGDYIELTAQPFSDDIAPKRNELLRILTDDAVITGSIDSMATGGTTAGIDYPTSPKFIA